ncbi:hypothetical protein H5410_001952 [Solanum commersonii]|uniref:Uncharacterized protein n=1 Tax=Solanum commersonii TaxID=4109 RepID=A0A9J6B112_SOLCO|nr:hypothetical protein H5410_001952 [Solanum commersonii]
MLRALCKEGHDRWRIGARHMSYLYAASLKINPDKICPNNVCVRVYDGSRRDTMGEIKLNMTIGPVDFMIVFQPWINMTRAIPSTLHQVIKFEYDHQEIIVYGEDDLSIYTYPSIPYIEAK